MLKFIFEIINHLLQITCSILLGLDDYASLVFNYGSSTPSNNVKLYQSLVLRLADCIRKYWSDLPSSKQIR